MKYNGKLYGKLAGKYFDTGKTSDDWDLLENDVQDYKAQIKSLQEQLSAEREKYHWTEKTHPLRDTFKRVELIVEEISDLNLKRLLEIEISNIKLFSGFIQPSTSNPE